MTLPRCRSPANHTKNPNSQPAIKSSETMKTLLALLLCLLCSFHATADSPSPPEFDEGIVVLEPERQAAIAFTTKFPVAQDAYPFIVQVRSFSGTHLCTGVLISSTEVLTLAHCIRSTIEFGQPLDVLVDGVEEEVCRVEYDSSFNANRCGGENDFAILVLQDSTKIRRAIGSLHTENGDESLGQLSVLGWFGTCVGTCTLCGPPASSQLHEQPAVNIESLTSCGINNDDNGSFLCASTGISTLCSWDLGQALISTDANGVKLVGLGVYGERSWSGCTRPTVFLRVDKQVAWLRNGNRNSVKKEVSQCN